MRIVSTLLTGALVLAVQASAGFAQPVCIGDCPPADGVVVVNELVMGVTIALDRQPLAVCPNFDANGDDVVAVAELVTAVNNAQNGCHASATPTATGAVSEGPATPTATPTFTGTPTVTPTPAVGPVIGFFGVTLADDTLQEPIGTDPNGIPIYERPFGFGFSLVVEAQPGISGLRADTSTFAPGDVPDLQIQTTRPLGDGSTAVCDNQPPVLGGVPGIDPPVLDDPASVADVLNDLGCRFIDGSGSTVGRACSTQGCVRYETGDLGCVINSAATVQFCGQMITATAFPPGDTLVTARVRDMAGNLGPPAQLIVRVTPP